MNAVGWLGNCLSQGVGVVSGPFHPFGGAIDIIVVEQPDGSFKSSPWYVQFGKFQGVLKTTEKVVNISVNGVQADFHMYLSHKGEAYFLEEVEVPEGESVPCPLSSGDETDGRSQMDRPPLKSKSCDFNVNKLDSVSQIDLSRASSRRSRILGFVFGRKSMKERELQDGSVPSVERASSLDCAEFAADLLEVNWSTNLTGDNIEKDSASWLPPPATSSGGADSDIQIGNEQSPLWSLLLQNDDSNLVDNDLYEIAAAHCEQTGVSLQSTSDNLDGSIEDICVEMLCSSPQEHDAATSVMIENVNEDICVISRKTDEYTTGNADWGDESSVNCTSKNADPNSQISRFTVRKVSPSNQFDGQNALEEKYISPVSQISKESITERVQSFNYCDELSERPIVGINGSTKQLHGTICISSISHEELHVDAKSVHASPDPREKASQSAVNERLDKHTGFEAVVVDPNNHYQLTNSSKLVSQHIDEVNHQVMLQCCTQTLAAEPISDSVEEVKPQSISFLSTSSDSSHQVQDGSITSDEKISNQPSLGSSDFIKDKVFNDLVPYNSEEKQFVSSELDESKLLSACCAGSRSLDFPDDKSHTISSPRGIEDVNGSKYSNWELFLYSDKSKQEDQVNDLESSTLMSERRSNPVNLPASCKLTSEEVLQHVKSLPNMSLHMEDLDANNTRHPLSQSVNSDSKSKRVLQRQKGPHLKTKEAECSYSLEPGQPNNEDTQNSMEKNNTCLSHAVEISCCKHLLYKGMGADAASRAFDSQKLNIDKFTNLDTDIVKDDRLVVKIGGCYFPWNADATHVLGLHSCGSNLIFEPKDSIPVGEAGKCPEGDPSKATTASPGSWTLWPFSSKGSRPRRIMQPDLNGGRTYVYENASDSSTGTDVEKEVHKPRLVKKTKRTKTPSSEQMASLKLKEEMKFKEGMNLVTFTFSTPMLGVKKVDARIYLWKWNTRIVISDVDGTITKSDVLGQFMPLVGIDWSQTGVTNLFSAIKENGYQLLFLSARSISQAYHTRQFLLNLKQDGKLLPDGPVVISPDGLFPSLFREVIRRVPQEFKIACLKNIKALFPSECNPFYAGFGNRDTDELSYLNVGIPRGKIFIINPRGEVALSRCFETKSYTSLHALVNGVFPPMSSDEQEDYNEWNYWKLPTPAIDI